jgi:hypothetical protein
MTERQRQHLREVLSKLRKKIAYYRKSDMQLGEQNTKASLIDPLLAGLGWDIQDPEEVTREYRKQSADSPVDYALCISRTARLFVEAKALGKNLVDRKWASQVLNYANVVGVEWCVLTNGDDYLVYNVHAPVEIEEKLFRSIKISDVASEFTTEDTLDLLSKDMLKEKRLATLWDAFHVDRQVRSGVENLWSGHDESLVRLIRKQAKGLTPRQVKASLERGRILIDFPVDVGETEEDQPAARRGRRGKRAAPIAPGLPPQSRIETPLLQAILRRGGRMEMRTQFDEVADQLGKDFGLTPQQKAAKTGDRRTTDWKNRIQWVRQHLITKGEIDGTERGIWKLTPKGQARASDEGRRGISLVEPSTT